MKVNLQALRRSLGKRLAAWRQGSSLLEWEQSVEWSDLSRERGIRRAGDFFRHLAFRTAPFAAGVFILGFWVVNRIPGVKPIPLRVQLVAAAPLVLPWTFPYLALKLRLIRPKHGRRLRVRLSRTSLQLVDGERVLGAIPWSRFDAFDFGRDSGFRVLRLRLPARRLVRPVTIEAFEVVGSAQEYAIRDVLMGRGLQEEPLGPRGEETTTGA